MSPDANGRRPSTRSCTSVPIAAVIASFAAPSLPATKNLPAAKERRRIWAELQQLRQVSNTWAGACAVQPAVRLQIFDDDRHRILDDARKRCHQNLEGCAIGFGLVCLFWLGYHVEPRWPRYWSTYSVGALSSLAAGILGMCLESKKAGGLRASATQFLGGLTIALLMPFLHSVGMPLAQLAAHHFIASATLGRLVLENWRHEWIALQLWLGAFICQLSWLFWAPTAFVVVLEMVMGTLMALIPASAVSM